MFSRVFVKTKRLLTYLPFIVQCLWETKEVMTELPKLDFREWQFQSKIS